MKKVIKISIYGSEYITSPELEDYSCSGCAMRTSLGDCARFGEEYNHFSIGHGCEDNRSILVAHIPLYTVSDVVDAIIACGISPVASTATLDVVKTKIEKFLQQETNPEYIEFMRLKKIYE